MFIPSIDKLPGICFICMDVLPNGQCSLRENVISVSPVCGTQEVSIKISWNELSPTFHGVQSWKDKKTLKIGLCPPGINTLELESEVSAGWISLERLCKFPLQRLRAEESLEEMGQHKSLSRKYNYLLILTLRSEAPEWSRCERKLEKHWPRAS